MVFLRDMEFLQCEPQEIEPKMKQFIVLSLAVHTVKYGFLMVDFVKKAEVLAKPDSVMVHNLWTVRSPDIPTMSEE